jgi:bifunctional non-homologous end joining protein LigD
MGVTTDKKSASSRKPKLQPRRSATIARNKKLPTIQAEKKTALTKVMRSVRTSGKEKLASFIKPMFAHIHENAFDDDKWIFEIKWDGYRAVAEIENGRVKLTPETAYHFYPFIRALLPRWLRCPAK